MRRVDHQREERKTLAIAKTRLFLDDWRKREVVLTNLDTGMKKGMIQPEYMLRKGAGMEGPSTG